MHTIDLVNLGLSRLRKMGVELRFYQHGAVAGGLCRIGQRRFLFLDEGSTATEQFELIADSFLQLHADLMSMPRHLSDAIVAYSGGDHNRSSTMAASKAA